MNIFKTPSKRDMERWASNESAQRKRFEELACVSTDFSKKQLVASLQRQGYREDNLYNPKWFFKGGLNKHYVIIVDTNQPYAYQFEYAEEVAQEILDKEGRHDVLIIVVCFANSSNGYKSLFEKYLSFNVTTSTIFGINQIRPVLFDKQKKLVIYNDYHNSSGMYSRYNKARQVIVKKVLRDVLQAGVDKL